MEVVQTMIKEPVHIAPSNPAAGNDWSTTIPTTYRPEFVLIAFSITTDANAANRSIDIKWAAGGIDHYFANISSIAAGESWYFTFQQGAWAVKNSVGLIMQGTLPQRMVWGNGGTLSSSTTNIQVGDQFADIDVYLIPHFNA